MATQVSTGLAIVIDVSAVLLSAYVIWIIEFRARRSVVTASPAQTERLEELRALDAPIRCVLDELISDNDVYVVYSSTEQREFVNHLGETVRPENDLTYGSGAEKRATTIPDAVGAGRIHSLLYLGGKRQRVRSITAWPTDFRAEFWETNLVLIGSGKSNRATTRALADFNSPYRFTDDLNAIIDPSSGTTWPVDPDELQTKDYGILVKLKVERSSGASVYLIAAGVGPYGTLAGCVFLERQIQRIYQDYERGPFAYVLSVSRDDLSYFAPQVEKQCALPVIRG